VKYAKGAFSLVLSQMNRRKGQIALWPLLTSPPVPTILSSKRPLSLGSLVRVAYARFPPPYFWSPYPPSFHFISHLQTKSSLKDTRVSFSSQTHSFFTLSLDLNFCNDGRMRRNFDLQNESLYLLHILHTFRFHVSCIQSLGDCSYVSVCVVSESTL